MNSHIPKRQKFLHLEPPQPVSARSQQRMILSFGVPVSQATAVYPEVAALLATYDRDYIHGDRVTRDRYGRVYAAYACAHPNILPIRMFSNDEDRPIKVHHPRCW